MFEQQINGQLCDHRVQHRRTQTTHNAGRLAILSPLGEQHQATQHLARAGQELAAIARRSAYAFPTIGHGHLTQRLALERRMGVANGVLVILQQQLFPVDEARS